MHQWKRRSLAVAAVTFLASGCAKPGVAVTPGAADQRAMPAPGPKPAPAAPQNRKIAKPGGGAMDLSILTGRIRLRRLAPAYVTTISQDGAEFRFFDGSIHRKTFALTGYCDKPRKVGSKAATRWVFAAFPDWVWQREDHAKGFCQGWNRLVYASLAGESIEQGFGPPPGTLDLTPGVARAMIKDLFPKRHLAAFEISGWTLSLKLTDLNPEKQTRLLDGSVTSITDFGVWVRYGEEKLVRKGRDLVPQRTEQEAAVPFEYGYIQPEHQASGEGSFYTCGGLVYAWKEARDAKRFCDAVNRLVFQAAMGDADNPFLTFSNAARSFRAGQRPEPPAEFERHRVLAENALQEKDYFTAIQHYEHGLRMFQTWPEGWFNAALLYEALAEWEYAIDRMNRYLQLAPDAPDAKAAKEKLIVWQEKAKR